jgi:hypothetical protein
MRLNTTPQPGKKLDDLPEHIEARLVIKTIKGKTYRILTSMVDAMRFPGGEMVELYRYRWEIEQELWGILLAYNLIRQAMTAAACRLDSVWPSQLSFASCLMAVTQLFATVPLTSPRNIPKRYEALLQQITYLKLPPRREDRKYPIWLKPKPSKYPAKKKNASQLN